MVFKGDELNLINWLMPELPGVAILCMVQMLGDYLNQVARTTADVRPFLTVLTAWILSTLLMLSRCSFTVRTMNEKRQS